MLKISQVGQRRGNSAQMERLALERSSSSIVRERKIEYMSTGARE